MSRIFLSYARTDAAPAARLFDDLKRLRGAHVWFDRESLLPGMQWRPAIRKAIREADYFIALLSSRSSTGRGFRNSELSQALEVLKEWPPDDVYLLPVRLDDCAMPFDVLDEIQRVDLFPDWGAGVRQLRKALVPRAKRAPPDTGEADQRTARRGARYQYRVGLADLDAGLTNLVNLAIEWSQLQDFFHFTCPPLPRLKRVVKTYNGEKNFTTRAVPRSFYEEHRYLGVDLIACMTRYPLAVEDDAKDVAGFFSAPSEIDERFLFLSLADLWDYARKAGATFDQALLILLLGQLIVYFADIGFHDATRGCVMDYCENRDDIVQSLRHRKLCNQCRKQLKTPGLRESIEQLLAWSA
jgi:hypothetical protein